MAKAKDNILKSVRRLGDSRRMNARGLIAALAFVFALAGAVSAQTPGTPSYPASQDNGVSLLAETNNAATTITIPVLTSDTAVNVTSTNGFPSSGAITIAPAQGGISEIVFYTGVTATSFTGCTRGQDGTSALSHAVYDLVVEREIAADHNVLAGAIEAIEAKLGIGSSSPTVNAIPVGTAPGSSAWETLIAGSGISISFSGGQVTVSSAGGAGLGSVTSIGMTVPSYLEVSPSSISSSGTFAITGASESGNQVLASPNGSSGALGVRSLVAADLGTGMAPQFGQVGIGVAPVGLLDITGNQTASGGFARTVRMTPTLTAAANNDTLSALYVNASFVNGSLTGVTNYIIRAMNAGTLEFSIDGSGNVVGTSFAGAGSSLTGLNASNVSSGTLGAGRLPTIGVAGGGTGDTSLTPYALLAGGTSSTGTLQQVGGLGTSGQVLTSNGNGALPTWQNASGGGGSSSGAAGSVQLSGGSGAFTADSSNFWWDATNHRLGVGTNSPGVQMQNLLTNSTTSAVDVAAIIGHNSSGTVANGFGVGLKFQLQDSVTGSMNAGQISAMWTNATDGSQSSVLSFSVVKAGASIAEGFRYDPTAGPAGTGALTVNQGNGTPTVQLSTFGNSASIWSANGAIFWMDGINNNENGELQGSGVMVRSDARYAFGNGTDVFVATADTAIGRNAAGVVEVDNGTAGSFGDVLVRALRSNAVTFANVPASPVEGMIVAIVDSTTATWGATITGSGSNHVLAYYDGTNWTVLGK
jgi:hypothetical protein